MTRKQNAVYGGQAVIEGVMFAGPHVNVTAVRRKSTQEIEFYQVPRDDKAWVKMLKKVPFLRGIVGIVESSAKGAQHLNFSADVFAEEEEEEERAKKQQSEQSEQIAQSVQSEQPVEMSEKVSRTQEKPASSGWSLSMVLGVAVVGVLSFIFGKFVFTLVPAAVESALFGHLFPTKFILHNIIEGIIKMILLLAYIYFISLTPMIKRLFQYHGAEHKVISAYEAGEELTVENVQKYSTLHYRCGSSFIVFTIIIGVIVYSFVEYQTVWERLYQRIILLPVVMGVSYEVLRFTNSLREVPVLRYLGYPGLWLQKLTTKEPTDDQVEVSIASFKHMLEIEQSLQEKQPQAV